jgi:hypothetical protein
MIVVANPEPTVVIYTYILVIPLAAGSYKERL